MQVEISPIDWQDTEALREALGLVRNVFWEYEAPEYDDEGVWEFDSYIELDNIRTQLAEDRMRIWAARSAASIIGVLAVLPTRHISLLFVDKAYHKQGIARALLQTATEWLCQTIGPGVLTVNSSPYAVRIYQRLGFAPTGPKQTVNGIRFVPMQRTIP